MATSLFAVAAVADVPVAFHAEDDPRRAAIDRLLSGLPTTEGPAEITVRYERRRPACPPRLPTHRYDDARIWHLERELFVQLDGTPVGARATPDGAQIGGNSERLGDAWQQLFHLTITHVLAHRDRFVLHAAGLVDRHDRAHVVLGNSGDGKSTLALAALTANWRVLSDDLVVVRAGADGPEATGIARRIAVPSDLGALESLDGRPLDGDHRRRYELAAGTLSHGWYPIAGTIVVGHSASSVGELDPLGADAAMNAVLGAFSSVTDPLLLAELFPLAGAVCRLPRRRLGHGADPATRLAVGRRLLGLLDQPDV